MPWSQNPSNGQISNTHMRRAAFQEIVSPDLATDCPSSDAHAKFQAAKEVCRNARPPVRTGLRVRIRPLCSGARHILPPGGGPADHHYDLVSGETSAFWRRERYWAAGAASDIDELLRVIREFEIPLSGWGASVFYVEASSSSEETRWTIPTHLKNMGKENSVAFVAWGTWVRDA